MTTEYLHQYAHLTPYMNAFVLEKKRKKKKENGVGGQRFNMNTAEQQLEIITTTTVYTISQRVIRKIARETQPASSNADLVTEHILWVKTSQTDTQVSKVEVQWHEKTFQIMSTCLCVCTHIWQKHLCKDTHYIIATMLNSTTKSKFVHNSCWNNEIAAIVTETLYWRCKCNHPQATKIQVCRHFFFS